MVLNAKITDPKYLWSGKCLTEEKEILSRWTEYCSELYNYESCGDNNVLDCSQPPEEDLQPILREEVEIAVASLKKGKSAGVDNIPAELVQAGGETMIEVLTEICNRIWRTGEWPTPWTQSLIITLPNKSTASGAIYARSSVIFPHRMAFVRGRLMQ